MFKENFIINGVIACETGLHIGDSKDSIDIGGSDSPIIRDSISGYPYIPGSSLKGKLRSLIELSDEPSSRSVIDNYKKNNGNVSTDENSISVKLFGMSPINNDDEKSNYNYQTRTIVRDSFPTEDTIKMWENNEDLFNGSELKWENTINRISSEATPRNIERIPKGSEFNFEIIFSTYGQNEYKNIIKLLEAINMLEQNYLGGSGSRGFGQVKFKHISIVKRDLKFYTNNQEELIIVDNVGIDSALSAIQEL